MMYTRSTFTVDDREQRAKAQLKSKDNIRVLVSARLLPADLETVHRLAEAGDTTTSRVIARLVRDQLAIKANSFPNRETDAAR